MMNMDPCNGDQHGDDGVHTVTWRVDDDRDIAMLLPLIRVHVRIHHLAEQVM